MTLTDPKPKTSTLFTHHFKSLEDPRRTTGGNFRYPLEEILFLTISAVISHCDEDWEDISDFGEHKLTWLRKFYPYEHGVPSHDVLNRFFNRLDSKKFNECFIQWVNSIAERSSGQVVALDGKTVRGVASDSRDSKLHIVSAFCTQNELCLGQVKVNDKSNEITAIPELLDLLTIKGCTITIDAMGCQKKIAAKIIEKQADYILMVKDNQKELKEQIETVFNRQSPDIIDIENDFGHGRIEKRTCEVITHLDFLYNKEQWTSLNSIVRVTSQVTDKKTLIQTEEQRYYISSLANNTQTVLSGRYINNAVRNHWGIENKLHWSLDVVMHEDGQLNYAENAAENMNMIKKIALGLIAKEKTVAKSKRKKMKRALFEDDYRELVLKI